MELYTVTDKSFIRSIFENGWSRQFAGDSEGVDYGVGQYCNIPKRPGETPHESIKRYNNNRASNCIIKSKLEGGPDGFIIFDLYFAKKVYGENYTIKDQIYKLFPENVANDLWKDIKWYMTLDKSPLGNSHHFQDKLGTRTAGLLQWMMSKRFHKNYANPEKYESLFAQYGVRGAIYHGNGDGFCAVVYNYDEVIPIAYSLDGGQTYINKTSDKRYPDALRKFKHIYKKIYYPVCINYGGDNYYFSIIQKHNGKYNVINAKNGDELSPVDFISITQITPPNGDFTIEYPENMFYKACPDGFYDKNGDGHGFDELNGFSEEDNDFSLFEEIVKECITEIKKKFSVNENSLDEFNYDGIDIPDESYFENESLPSIYHVTNKEAAENMFKTGYDQEFMKVAAYGRGVYTAIDVKNGRNQLGSYGDTMIQFKLIGGYRNFLIFNEYYAKKIYGEHHSILSQLKTFMSHDDAHELFNKCRYDVRSYSQVANKYKIHGAVYDWGRTIAVLPFDMSLCYPYAVSYDGGKTFIKKANKQTFERFASSVDVDWRFGAKYKNIKKAIKFKDFNGNITGYSLAQKYNGKYNIVNIQTGEEISPVDFDSCTPINPIEGREYGNFSAEYNGVWFNCNIEYYKDSHGNRYEWKNFPNFDSDEDDDLGDIDF